MDQTPEKLPEGAQISFEALVDALLDQGNPFPARYLYRLSDLAGEELKSFAEVWPRIAPERRRRLLEDLEVFAESDMLASFEAVGKIGLTDPNPDTRLVAIRVLWEFDDPELVPIFLDIFHNDPDPRTQAQAASGLSHFVNLGEFSKIDREVYQAVTAALFEALESHKDDRVRRAALESLGFSSDPNLPAAIERAYRLGDEDWLASALLAMGRTADEQWQPFIVENLSHSDSKVRFEAAQAAGELAIEAALPMLLELIQDEDDDVRMAAVWSLSEIGGEDVEDTLQQLLVEADDEDEIEVIEDALENLAFNQNLQDFNLLSFSEDDLEDMIHPSPDGE